MILRRIFNEEAEQNHMILKFSITQPNLMGLLFTNCDGIDAVFNTRLDLGGSVLGGWGFIWGFRLRASYASMTFYSFKNSAEAKSCGISESAV